MSSLELYQMVKAELENQAKTRTLLPDEYWFYQELTYRCGVLETFRFFLAVAPVTMEQGPILTHYYAVDALVSHLLQERRIAHAKDEKEQAARETSYHSFGLVQKDYRRRFSEYAVETPEQYRADISKTIHSILPLWIQYRNTMINI